MLIFVLVSFPPFFVLYLGIIQRITPASSENKSASAAIEAATASAEPPPLPTTQPPPLEDEYEDIEYGTGGHKATFSVKFGIKFEEFRVRFRLSNPFI